MSLSPWGQMQACPGHTAWSQCWHVVLRALRLPVLGAYTWDPVFLHREQVAVQRRGVTAGTEVHECLGGVGGLQREREVLCA